MSLEPISVEEAIKEITEYIRSSRIVLSSWYVGITDDWANRLFTEHNVPSKDSWYIARMLESRNDAGTVEKHFLDSGTKGGGGGGAEDSVYVYAYVIGPSTKESS